MFNYNKKDLALKLYERLTKEFQLNELPKYESILDEVNLWFADKMAVVWHVKDVAGEANSMGLALTEEECSEVLYSVLDNYDSQYGVNWDVIRSSIEYRKVGRKLTDDEDKRHEINGEIIFAEPAKETVLSESL